MAKIIENERRIVKLSVDDVLNIVREYQRLTRKSCCYNHTREILAQNNIYIHEDVYPKSTLNYIYGNFTHLILTPSNPILQRVRGG